MRRLSLLAVTAALGAALVVPFTARSAPTGDPQAGARAFATCSACHTRTAAEPLRMGPTLAGAYGKKAGSNDARYAYSPALKAANITWTDKSLDAWLTKPGAVAPGTKMAFAGVPDPQVRANIIAYLKTLGR
jgi:cytochrome c